VAERSWSAARPLAASYLFMVPRAPRRLVAKLPGHGGPWEFRISQSHQILEVKARAGAREQTVRGTRLRARRSRLVDHGRGRRAPLNQMFRAW